MPPGFDHAAGLAGLEAKKRHDGEQTGIVGRQSGGNPIHPSMQRARNGAISNAWAISRAWR